MYHIKRIKRAVCEIYLAIQWSQRRHMSFCLYIWLHFVHNLCPQVVSHNHHKMTARNGAADLIDMWSTGERDAYLPECTYVFPFCLTGFFREIIHSWMTGKFKLIDLLQSRFPLILENDEYLNKTGIESRRKKWGCMQFSLPTILAKLNFPENTQQTLKQCM